MKSAYELAMERLEKNTPSQSLTDEQKAALAELNEIYSAKIEEKRILAEKEMNEAMGNYDAVNKIQERLQTDISRLEAERDEKKEAVRQQKNT